MANYAMTRAERAAFLAETHVAMLAVDNERGRAPFLVPVWYWYRPGGDVHIVTGGASRKVPLLQKAGRASLCVQTETMPYMYVSVEGPVSIVDQPDFERDVREVALRYLGEKLGELYLAATTVEHETAVLVRLKPERWQTVDFTKFGT
jgi:nitroimidazol reductase NimA-like FMN-containing flavoprotein (pyridoxamine 5'-phosphate oxidase superfamily)